MFSNPRGLQATDGLLDALVELLVVRTRVAEAGRDSRQLFLRTGIDAGEHQARRLLNDIAGFRAWLEQKQGRPVSEVVAANQWLEEVYDPVIGAIPGDLSGRLPPAEIFHEVLEHRWYMSEAAGRDVGTTAATRAYVEQVLPAAPEPLESGEPLDPEHGEPLDLESGGPLDLESGEPLDPVEKAGQLEL